MTKKPSRSPLFKEVLSIFSNAKPFRLLPDDAIEELAEWATEIKAIRGQLVAEQAKTKIGQIFYIRRGAIELYYEEDGVRSLGARLVGGETFGGISVLMNAGVAVRTAKVEEDALLYAIPAERFMALCEKHPEFRAYFTEAFQQRKRDQSYAAILVTGQARDFLSGIVPFSFLSEKDLDEMVNALSLIHHDAGTILFVQGQSRVDYLYIIQKGAAELYYEQAGEKNLKGYLGEGDTYGGISLLLNKGVSIRTLRVEEDAYLYALPEALFLRLCRRCPAFSDYFTDTFGKRMLDRSYAEIFARKILPKDEAVHIFNVSVARLMNRDILSCSHNVPVQQAATLMSRRKVSSIFIQNNEGQHIGIVTDTDLRNRVIAQGLDITIPISTIMSSPLSTIAEQLSVFEAMLVMMQKGLKHLAVLDSKGNVIGTITSRDLLAAQGQSPLFIVREIASSLSREELSAQQSRIPGLVQNLIGSGAKAENVTRLIATVSDAILHRLLEIALEEKGPPPVPFVFMIMGSEGRREQTLKTDQDNAIIFQDIPEAKLKEVKGYFLDLGETVCTWLDEIGYDFCKGGVMAMNPTWCQPLSAWCQKFTDWIHTAEAEDLLHSSIFFDFRGGYGDFTLIDQLRRHLFDALGGWSGFFRHLTENALHFKPPLGFFRNFVVESKGKHRNSFDIKQAMLPVVDFARIHALKNGIAETNTVDRLYQLQKRGVLSEKDYTDISRSYSFMMQLRFVRQISAIIEENGKPDNYINPKKLSRIEQTMLKEIFKRVEDFQTKMSFEFTGQ